MNYQQILPAESLRKYVRCFWTLEDDSADFSQKTFRIIPDGLPGLIFQEIPNAFTGDGEQQIPELFLYGQTTSSVNHIAKCRFRILGVYFQPTALKSIFGIGARVLTDQNIALNELIKTTLTEQLLNSSSFKLKVDLLSAFFLKQINRQKRESREIDFATTQLLKGENLKSIQNELHISERSLERYFKEYIGVSPKLYERINRFQYTLRSMRKANFVKLTDFAYENNYFDQSHFIRDFKEFAGTSPKNFMLHVNEQVINFPEWKI